MGIGWTSDARDLFSLVLVLFLATIFFIGYSAGSCLQGVFQLKNQLKKDDVVVCIFHDHGSRYVGKVYNDQWMIERGFLEMKTFKDIISGRGNQKLVVLQLSNTVAEAVAMMKKYDIENIPVMENGKNAGAISEGGLFDKILVNPGILSQTVSSVLEKPYPEVSFDTPVELKEV